jgi:hypothetical protein
MKSVTVDLPVFRENENEQFFTFITKTIPLPPNFKSENLEFDEQLQELQEEREQYEIGKLIQQNSLEDDLKEEWESIVMKRYPQLLYLSERLRPFSKKPSFSIDILKKFEFIKLNHQKKKTFFNRKSRCTFT